MWLGAMELAARNSAVFDEPDRRLPEMARIRMREADGEVDGMWPGIARNAKSHTRDNGQRPFEATTPSAVGW
jgi:hypothetical protein